MKKFSYFLLSALIIISLISGTASANGFSEDPDAIEEKLKSLLMLEVYDDDKLIATGSGFCAFDNRTLITNYHVIKDADYLIAYSDSGDPYFIFHVLIADKERDIAILSFFSPTDLVPLSLNTDGPLRRAEKVVAIGSPLGITNTVAAGIISGIYTDNGVSMIQFTAPISPGSSGGALFDDSGSVIGITTSTLTRGQNINLAVHISEAVAMYGNWDGTRTKIDGYQPGMNSRAASTPKPTPRPTPRITPSSGPSASLGTGDVTGYYDYALPGGLLCLEEGSGYTLTVDPENNTCEITDPDRNIFMCEVHSCEELGLSEEIMRMSLSELLGQTQEGVTYGDRTWEANGFIYITMNYYGFMNGFTAVGSGAVLFVYSIGAEDTAAYEKLLGALRPTDTKKAEAPSSSSETYIFGTEDIAGVYDNETLGGKITEFNLILTRGGHGRLSNSSDSFTFNFEIRDGQIVIVPNTDDISFTFGEDRSVTIHFEGNRLRFVKRDSIAGSPRITGKWKFSKMIINGKTIELVKLGFLGYNVEFTAYDDGTVDWYAVSDSENWLAQSWGIDEDGLYIFNGQRSPCTMEDGVLCLILNGTSNQQAFFTYVGPVD